MVKYIYILLLTTIFFSCKNESELEYILSDDSKKWILDFNQKKNDPEMPLPPPPYNIFNKNGNVTLYYTFVDGETPIRTTKWKYSEKDSVLNMFELDFKVLKFQEDTIFLQYKKYKPLLIKYVNSKK
ncbi:MULTISPECIES: hypothetical protein [Flavobacterium]|uniref:hypothetical protein n=1 Tax=Flavobacterium TaxID=237 RepID=UPI001FCAAFC3|nr:MULTISPECIES: hypothetical protein [Flavobacterium]UOK42202.1 hypothetical protein LZF87_12895 [Flavobacterium enshiense]